MEKGEKSVSSWFCIFSLVEGGPADPDPGFGSAGLVQDVCLSGCQDAVCSCWENLQSLCVLMFLKPSHVHLSSFFIFLISSVHVIIPFRDVEIFF